MRQLLRLAEFAEKGAWPVAGGTLDQTQWCVEAFQCVWNNDAAEKPPMLSLS